ncbi:MAG: glycosyltransferase, partial [Pseudomonas sp.]|nr:glycosyltransferase [Pseudomonas sp.]
MKRSKVLQLQPDYNVKSHDFADLAEQIVRALPRERYEITAAFLRGRPGPGEPVSKADHSVYFEFSDKSLK